MAQPVRVPKAQRRRLARSEVWMLLASTAQRWADDIAGNPGVIPFDQWDNNDPFVKLCRIYGLTAADLTKLLTEVGGSLEDRAMRTGYEEAWPDEEGWPDPAA